MDNQNKCCSMKCNSGIGVVIAFFVLLFVFAKWGPAINFSTMSQVKGEPFVVSGQGKVFVTPDIAKITLGIQESGLSLKAVQESANIKSKALTSAIQKLGVDEKDIKTVGYYLYPQYDYQGSVSRITGYQVSVSYQVTIRDFDKVNDIVASSVAAGANMAGGVNFEVNDETQKEKLQEARDLAVTEAKEKANSLAKAAGINLGKIINISEDQPGGGIRPLYNLTTIDMAGKEAEPTTPNIEPGQTEIEVTISLSYEVR